MNNSILHTSCILIVFKYEIIIYNKVFCMQLRNETGIKKLNL